MTVGEWIRLAQTRLGEEARIESQMLAAHVLGVDRTWILTHPEHDFNDLAGEQLLQRREQHEPLAYILGWREFYGRRFGVKPGVLIPRQETEILVEEALSLKGRDILDFGTGSGCIAITLALEDSRSKITAIDISPIALEIARQNATDLGAEVEFVQSDAFDSLNDRTFDLIVTNPPYVGRADELPPEVRDFEPESALFAPGETLSIYHRLAVEARPHLADDGILLTEIGAGQALSVATIFERNGWKHAKTTRDLSGIERVLTFTV